MVSQAVLDFINKVYWKRTNYIGIHEYIVRDWYLDNEKEFWELVDAINQEGFKERFGSKEYTYLRIGDYRYWYMDPVINRRLEHQK